MDLIGINKLQRRLYKIENVLIDKVYKYNGKHEVSCRTIANLIFPQCVDADILGTL